MIKKIFYFNKLSKTDGWTIAIYFLLSVYIFWFEAFNHKIIFFYSILTQIGLYVFYYKALRNLSFYLFWIVVGVFHWLLYFHFLNNFHLTDFEVSMISTMRNTFPLIVLFQVLRISSLFVQGKELVSPQPASFKSEADNRYVNWIDYLLFFTYLIILLGLTFT